MAYLGLADLAARARPLFAPSAWDFVAGGSGDERTLAANRTAFEAIRLRPRMLRGIAAADPAVQVFGRRWSAPVGVAPMAYHGLAHPGAEPATVAGAGAAGLPVIAAMLSGHPLEDLAAAALSPLWLQLYPLRDRAVTADLLARAETAGVEAIVLTVDAPRLGDRRRDKRSGFRLPPGLAPANLAPYRAMADPSGPAAHTAAAFEPAIGPEYVAWLASRTRLPVVVKGVLRGDDATRAVESGAAGVLVSNHGGRQLDGAVAAVDAVAEVAAAVDVPVFVDGGVRGGADVLAALARGATATFVGRPVLHALAVGGASGVEQALAGLTAEYADALLLAGCRHSDDVDESLLADGSGAARHRGGPGDLDAGLLHGSVTDPLLDTMTFLNEVTERFPDAVSFAPGRPYDAEFSLDDVLADVRAYVDHRAAGGDPAAAERSLLQYGPTAGLVGDLIARLLASSEDVHVPPESIVVTVGAQEALLLALRTLCASRDDVLVVPGSCYVGVCGAARLLDLTVRPVRETADGIDLGELDRVVHAERVAGRRVRACYVVPDAANPSGATLSRADRVALLSAARRHDFLILEDSPYRVFAGADPMPSLKSLDTGRRVVQIGSFAKTAYPGLRVGYLVADQTVRHPDGRRTTLAGEIAKVRGMVTCNAPGLTQAALGGFLLRHDFRLDKATATAAAHYRRTLDEVLRTLDECFPAGERERLGVAWNVPAGGFFLRLRVPFRADEAALRRSATEYGVIWTPMAFFALDGGGRDEIRLSCSALDPARARDGIQRLARMIRDQHQS
ncbi:aminotransferase class I/II-fold pyridoxal phosphate-dependent enzyme [Phytohabitans sp. ZYX-F-186]|uniref:Aminotransferase class I/II-fold pyridoxal phosphate-dependent enzyme n=1 Tax=Phytohabitans maris TaxID=3071409 RepID=A0ABU0ZDM6_9ACTN|nr:aminotransferase class I/II-fold pyridoxal phosphate-dependent enzyme [Phytohabitans sp. ZYX-F-186]MDQ7905161.1 aminotransferase class I/II-fold pyridoxal phosphate-dependent enzyme [Phytohabitans sp. ZYX-F-186]